ncbi:MAG: K(+)-transporting ATPase subunit C [Planctomycetota bacterium]
METQNGAPSHASPVCHTLTALRIVLATLLVCCVTYPGLVLLAGWTFTPHSASGSLVTNARGQVVGSELIGQGFSKPLYFWSRPSAVDFNALGAGGSNLSPASPELRSRVEGLLGTLGASAPEPVPIDLVTASGSGLDPHITLAAAWYQAGRVARARGLAIEDVRKLIEVHARCPGGLLTPEPLVNVLRLNMALDESR